VRVNSTDPTIFYSSQGDECSGGMIGIINQGGERNLTDYRERASELARAVSPPAPYGGERVDADEAESGGDGNDNDDDEDNDNNDDDDNDGDDNEDEEEGEDGAAGSLRVNLLGLLGVTAFAFFLA
jgi:peroxisome-assembly ATPase